jgi:TolB-like protein
MSDVIAIVPEPIVGADECREQMKRILSSPDFETTEREHRFLAYIVEETLQGRGDRIKAYSIAVEVFGREASFDAQHDPIVRIAAGHLRRAIERYYLTGGRNDPVRIDIPKGSYVPRFARNAPADAEPSPAAPPGPDRLDATPPDEGSMPFWRGLVGGLSAATIIVFAVWYFLPSLPTRQTKTPEVPRILVTRLEDMAKTGSSASVANGLTQEIVAQLSKFKEIVVLQATEGGVVIGPPPRFVVAGSVDIAGDAFRLRIRFVNQEDGSVLWADSFGGALKASELVHAQSLIASSVATNLAQSYGVIFQADTMREISSPPDDWAAYSCTLSYYSYRTNLEPSALPQVRECLEKSVKRYPEYATAWALLAQTYLEDVRFRIPYDPSASPQDVQLALDTARHAVRLDPYNTRGLQAEMFALFFSKQYEAGKVVGEKAIRLNPNDTELMGEYGYRLAVSGDWARGCSLIAEARARNPGMFSYYESGLALCAYFSGSLEEAVMWIGKTTAPSNPIYRVIAAAIYGEAGRSREAEKEISWLCDNQPALLKNIRQEVTARLGRVQDIELFISSLGKAGALYSAGKNPCSRQGGS